MVKKIKQIFLGNGFRAFTSVYAIVTLIGALLLMLPTSVKEGVSLSFIDALFVSVSGISTTGLSTINVSETFTRSGQLILSMILQFGGIGLIMLLALFWGMLGKKVGLRERNMIMQDQNQVSLAGVTKLVKNIIIILFTIEFLAFISFSIYFILTGADGMNNSLDSIFNSFFLTISLITNAGFDITGDSLISYNNDYFVQSLSMILMFTGAVGFWPLVELKDYLSSKIKGKKFKFSMFSKIIVSAHITLWLGGAVIMFLVETSAGNFFENKDLIESVFGSLFMSLSARNAGFATYEMSNFTEVTHMLFNSLMFLGSSPNSAGGGIRSTTIIIIIAAVYSFAIGRKQVVIKKRSISQDAVLKAYTIFVGAIFLVVFNTTLLLLFEQNNSSIGVNEALFEVISAFGTTGLSLGITGSIGLASKIILIATMFIGRVGIVTIFLLIRSKKNKNSIKYPTIELIVG